MRTESVQMLRKTSGGDNPLRGERLRYEDWLLNMCKGDLGPC